MDEISRLFENISPTDFAPNTTAVRVDHLETEIDDAEAFMRFTIQYIEGTRLVHDATEGDFPGIVVLRTGEESRVLLGEYDESTGGFMKRAEQEASDMNAMWVFAAVQGVAALGHTIDTTTEEGKKQFDAQEHIDVVNWYAESKNLGAVRFGVLHINDGLRIYAGVDPKGTDPGFRAILN